MGGPLLTVQIRYNPPHPRQLPVPLEELSHSGPRLSPPQIFFVRVINTPHGPQTTISRSEPADSSSIPPHLKRTLLIREELSSSETSPPELPEITSYSHTVASPSGGGKWPADMKPAEPRPIAQGLHTGGSLGVAWAALRAAWCVSNPLYKQLRAGDRLLEMSQGQGLRVATFATIVVVANRFMDSRAGVNNDRLPQIMAAAASNQFTFPQMIQIEQPHHQGTTFTCLGALVGVLASTWKIHRYPGPRVGAVQQIVGSAAVGWFWAAAGQTSYRLSTFRYTNAKLRDENKGQQG